MDKDSSGKALLLSCEKRKADDGEANKDLKKVCILFRAFIPVISSLIWTLVRRNRTSFSHCQNSTVLCILFLVVYFLYIYMYFRPRAECVYINNI